VFAEGVSLKVSNTFDVLEAAERAWTGFSNACSSSDA
jgi:hypothetical protein